MDGNGACFSSSIDTFTLKVLIPIFSAVVASDNIELPIRDVLANNQR
jgi:hypothetical protein